MLREREREAAASRPSFLWVPQRHEVGCPPVRETRAGERTVIVWSMLMLAAAGSQTMLFGPVALLPALPGACGIVGVMLGIRGLLVVANGTACLFSLLYLVLAFFTYPQVQAICTHIQHNIETCHQCASQSAIEQCHGDVESEFGPRCYSMVTGAGCLGSRRLDNECQLAAMQLQPRPPCYCVHDIWDPSWFATCDEVSGYSDDYIESKTLGYFLLCCVGVFAAIDVGCLSHDQFVQKMSFSHGQQAARARRVGVASELRSDLIGVDGPSISLAQSEEPVQVVDGVTDSAWQLQSHRDTPIGLSTEPVDGSIGKAENEVPIAIMGVVVDSHQDTKSNSNTIHDGGESDDATIYVAKPRRVVDPVEDEDVGDVI
eukprot:COSAG02_NODE_2398_length_8949_cov_423.229944_3_plen_373_part_00